MPRDEVTLHFATSSYIQMNLFVLLIAVRLVVAVVKPDCSPSSGLTPNAMWCMDSLRVMLTIHSGH